MPAAYPASLPLAMLDKTRSQPAAFTVAQPRRGFGYVEPTGTDVPVFWRLKWRLTTIQASAFRNWFRYTLQNGVLPFAMDVRTEAGLIEHELQFLPEDLLPARQIGGDLWEYSANVMARSLLGEEERDPEFTKVLLLLHGDGSNGSTTFTDSSSYARSVTRLAGGITIATAQSKFGGASIYGDSADRLQVSIGAEFTGRNWCVESFIRRRSAAFNMMGWFYAGANLIGRIDGTGGSGTYKLQLILSGSIALSSTSAIPADTWTHVRISCEQASGSNNNVRLFVDGVLNDSIVSTDPNLSLPGALTYSIGRWDSAGNSGFYAYVDEYRLTMATRETSDFQVPANAYPNSGL